METKKLLAALERLYPTIASSPIIDEMENFRFADNRLRASDGQMMVQVELDESTGLDCLVAADKFYKLLSSSPEKNIKLSLDGDTVVIKGRRILGKYKVTQGAEFLDNLDFDVQEWTPVPDDFLQGLGLCKFAASKDAARGVICGILVNGKTIMASDGLRIARYEHGQAICEEPMVLSMGLVAYLQKYGKELAGFARKGDVVYFSLGEGTVVGAKLLLGDFPSLDEFFGQADDLKLAVTLPDGLADALRRHNTQLSGERDGEVVMSFSDGRLDVSSSAVDYELTETLKADGGPSGFQFKIQPDFLTDILARTKEMHFDNKSDFVRFGDDKFGYLAYVDRVEK